MIIKGLFRRYERWNPVHPTVGAFWGMGVGVGCGVGWGPGFGPEVIGYVGAGCGLGFSVGLTVAGFGIGLPANSVIQLPFNGNNAWYFSLGLIQFFCFSSTRPHVFVDFLLNHRGFYFFWWGPSFQFFTMLRWIQFGRR